MLTLTIWIRIVTGINGLRNVHISFHWHCKVISVSPTEELTKASETLEKL